MWTVDKFLCFFELETGGLIQGWIGIVFNIILFFIFIYGAGVIHVTTCLELGEILLKINPNIKTDDDVLCDNYRRVLLIVTIIIIMCIIGKFLVDCFLIAGIKTHDHACIKPKLIVSAISGVFSVIECAYAGSITGAFLIAFIYGYLWICTYSLFIKIRNEKHGLSHSLSYVHYTRP